MIDRQHPYRRCVQYTIEILHIPLRYPIKDLEYDVMGRWGRCIESCKIIGNDADIRGTRIFYINFSNEYEQQAIECAEYLQNQGYLTGDMWLRQKVREVEPRGRERGRGRGRGRGQRITPDQLSPGYNLPTHHIPFPDTGIRPNFEIPKKEFIVHVKNIPSFVDEDIFKDMILDADFKFIIREEPSNDLLKEALVYVPDDVVMRELISKLIRIKVGGNTLDAKEKGTTNPAQRRYPSDDMQQPPPDARHTNSRQQGNDKQHAQLEPEPCITQLNKQLKGTNVTDVYKQKTILMSSLLYEFVRVKMKTQIDGFCRDRGNFRHENGVLFLESYNEINLTTIHTTLTTEVCMLLLIVSRDDIDIL